MLFDFKVIVGYETVVAKVIVIIAVKRNQIRVFFLPFFFS